MIYSLNHILSESVLTDLISASAYRPAHNTGYVTYLLLAIKHGQPNGAT